MNLEKEVFELAIDDIMPNRFQPREKFDEHSLNELALSIKEHGVIQPIIVRKIGDKYEIVAGERRFRASKIVGKKTIPALIRNIEDKESAKIALLENLQRKNLTAIEEARTYQTILKLDNLTQEELANNLGKSQSAVANKIRLLNLDLEVQNALLEEKISERHARSLLNLEDRNKQKEYLQKVILNRMTVKQLDEEIAQITGKKIEETIEEPEGQNPPSGGIISNFVDSPEIVNAIVSDNVIPPTQNASSEVFPLPVEEQKNVLEQPTVVETPIVTSAPVVEEPKYSFEQPAVESIPPISTESVLNNPTLEVPTSEPVVAENITEQPSQVPNFFNTRLSREKEEASILQPIEETREIVESTPIEESTPISSEMSAYDSIEKLLREGNEKQAEENKEIEEEKILDSLNNNIEEPKYSFEQPAVVETPIVTPAPVVEEPKYSFEQPTVEPVIQINEAPVIESNNVVSDSMSEQVVTPIIQTPVVEAKKDDIYDLRFAINNFRQAVQNTEKFGFNIETEEFDFNNIYQIVIKIDKNK